MNSDHNFLYAHRIGIDTYRQAIVFMRSDCDVCRSEGFEALARVRVSLNNHSVIATINMVSPEVLPKNKIGLSEFTWKILNAKEGDIVKITHSSPLDSLSHVRSKVYGNELDDRQMQEIVNDIAAGLYSDIHLSSFITACSGGRLTSDEILKLTRAMINVGDKLTWPAERVVDKHCVGGLPGNRTTLLVVPIVAAFGMTIPKTSSRAITSPAGTADTMEVLAPVQLNLARMREVVEKENGCIVWGGAADLSPADDILVRVERALNLDNEGQLVASVLSKKVSAGSNHVVIDMPIGPTAKLRSRAAADDIKRQFEIVGKAVGLNVEVVFTDGVRPVGRGIGPALEARDVLDVLQNKKDAPQDLRERSIMLAGKVLEFSPKIAKDEGAEIAREILGSGKAWQKFQAICEAQGGLFEPPAAPYRHTIAASHDGAVALINNRRLATIAKLAGAPRSKVSGIELHANIETKVSAGQPLFTIHSESSGELEYAVSAIHSEHDIFTVTSS